MRFGDILEEILVKRKISQSTLASTTGYDKSLISKFISGDQEPKYTHFEQIADALGMLPGDFFNAKEYHQHFHPIILPYCVVRPLFEDITGKCFLYNIMAFEDFLLPNIQDTVPPDAVQIVYIRDGEMIYGDKKLVSGTLHSDTLRQPISAKIKKGAYYYIFLTTENIYSLAEILEIRNRNIIYPYKFPK